ncbi:hypothetical protein [Granulicella tundricola]|uniref:Uncharacterized protein n=1 Tax=Granulicella tundricola (strain ATCC BAA-1859 / DSM 23138 / MP5ACTX9) TaxID=1198114 RepID=E8X0N7_GRATM|nr:hypothetical protein [Granulicella tundricola]ADW68988.1 hypothetical protein AciX9_1942 [Granulicella tundricola MP5ACTX9]
MAAPTPFPTVSEEAEDRFELATDRFLRKWGHLLVKDYPKHDPEFTADFHDFEVESIATHDLANSN